MPPLTVGIISDLHGILSNAAYKELETCDVILCAGDVKRESILMELEAIAPTIAVKGNCDYPSISSDVPFTASPRIGGVRFLWFIVLKISEHPPKMFKWSYMATLIFRAIKY